MGFFWDLIQQSQISDQRRHSETLEERVSWLEGEVDRLHGIQARLLEILERHFGTDIDGDGKVG